MFKFKKNYPSFDPDEIFIDSENLPGLDLHQFEGRLNKPISAKTFLIFGGLCLLVGLTFVGRLWNLQIVKGASYAEKSENNSLERNIVFSSRGIIYDRNGVRLAWNVPPAIEGDSPGRE